MAVQPEVISLKLRKYDYTIDFGVIRLDRRAEPMREQLLSISQGWTRGFCPSYCY